MVNYSSALLRKICPDGELVEAPDQVEHVATAKELAALAKWKREREDTHRRFGYSSDYGEPKIPRFDDQYNGRLAIRLEKCEPGAMATTGDV